MPDTGTMRWNEKNGTPFLTFPSFDDLPFVRHAFSTRLGGVSEGVFSSMNLGFRRGDREENVWENYRRICAAAGFDPQKLTASSQDHHTVIRRVTMEQAGIGFTRPRDLESVDGLCTDTPGLTLVTYYADCVPHFFADKRTHAVGAAHSGWRGTVARIGAEMVRRMGEEFSSDPADLIVGIGPSIGPECYEVDQPVADQFLAMQDLDPERFVRPIGEGKYLLDLWECNRRVLASAGIPEENISCAQLCTKCHPDLLYSHRVMGAQRGNLAAMICRREDD